MNIKNNIISFTAIQTQQLYTVYINLEEMKIILKMNITKYVHKFYLNVKQQSSVVADLKVQLINQSLKKWMLWVANIINYLCGDFKLKWHDFYTMYHHHNKKNLNSKKIKFFCTLFKELWEHVLKRTQIVVCTVNNADNYKLYEHFYSVVIFVNETAKMTKLNVIILLIWNLNKSIIFIDDHLQLKLIILSQITKHFYN